MVNRLLALLAIGALATAHCARGQSRHNVVLSWTASSDAAANPSLTYNIYRSAACSENFVKLNATPDSATTFVDTAAFAGSTYCYQVTAVLNGAESAPSNEATAAIPAAGSPTPPQPAPCVHRGPLIGWLRCIASLPHEKAKSSSP